jgi:hypothetical protein
MHNTCDCHRFEKDGREKSDFRTAKKGGQKGNPIYQNFVQLTNKIEKLENIRNGFMPHIMGYTFIEYLCP